MGTLLQGWSSFTEGTLGTAQNRGTAFVCNDSGVEVTHIGWYRVATGTNRTPVALRIYDQFDGSSVAVPSVVDSGAVGWQWSPLSSPFVPLSGRDYIVAVGWNNGQQVASDVTADPGNPDSPMTWETPVFRYSNNGPNSYPDQSTANRQAAVDIQWDDPPTNGPPPDGPSGEPEDPPTIADLSWWLHKDTENPDSIGKKLESDLEALGLNLEEFEDGAVDHFNNLNVLIGLPLNTSVTATLFGRLKLVQEIAETLDEVINAVRGAGNLDLDAISSQIASQAPLGRSPVDTTSVGDPTFTEAANRGGTGAFAWDQPADTYVLTITNPQDLRSGVNIEGVPYFKHRGSWSSLDNGIVGDYHSIVGTSHLLREVGARLQGVVVYLEPHINWTIQAFDYTG